MSKSDTIFINLLKKYTNIDTDFINTFFKNFKIGGELDFHIKDGNVAKYLGITLKSLRNRLLNQNSKSKNYIEKVDYIKIKSAKSNAGLVYMINYQCFERLARSGDSVKSESVRNYFVKLREFLTDNQKLIYQALSNKDDLKKYIGFECIYFFVADDKYIDKLKLGSAQNNIIKRLRSYNVGRIKEIDLKYLAIVKNVKIIEACVKSKLKDKQFYENREIFEIDQNKLKKLITDCYCKYVTKKENDTMYNELSELAGLYSYIKSKKHHKPYIVIDKKIL